MCRAGGSGSEGAAPSSTATYDSCYFCLAPVKKCGTLCPRCADRRKRDNLAAFAAEASKVHGGSGECR